MPLETHHSAEATAAAAESAVAAADSDAIGRIKAPPVCVDSKLKREAMSTETLQQWVFPPDAVFPSSTTTSHFTAAPSNYITRVSSSGWSRSSIASGGTIGPGSGWSRSSVMTTGTGDHPTTNDCINPTVSSSSSSQILPGTATTAATNTTQKVPIAVVAVSSDNSCGDFHAALSADELPLDPHGRNGGGMKPPPSEHPQHDDWNAKVARRKTSRQGRSTQRWVSGGESVATTGGHSSENTANTTSPMIRLVTGCVPILRGGRILVLSASRKAAWILPKGGWELDEKMEESAVRECFEESGCLGTLGPALTPVQYETRKAKKRRLEQEQHKTSHQQSTVAAEVAANFETIPKPADGDAANDGSPKEAATKDAATNGSTKEPEANDTNGGARNNGPNSSTQEESKVKQATTATPPTTPTSASNGSAATMSAEVLSRIRNSTHPTTDETMSVGSTFSTTTYSQAQMTLFPLYVREIKDDWPEKGRFRKALPLDEAIDMLDNRPELQAVLMEVKERGLHIVESSSSSSATEQQQESDTKPIEETAATEHPASTTSTAD